MDSNATIQTPTLSVTIRDREGIIFEGPVTALSSFNDKGPFDVLPMHANFISLIHRSLTLHFRDLPSRRLEMETGVLKVRDNMVQVYLGVLH